MFGLESLAMGEGASIAPSSSAASQTGAQTQGSFYGGAVNTYNPNKPNYLVLGGFALVALVLWKKLL